MDNHERKRRDQIARHLAELAIIIRMMLEGLDRIVLALHIEADDMRERIADDFLMVADNVLPTVDAPGELLAMARATLMDWVVANDLVSLMQATGVTPRRLATAEAVIERCAVTLAALHDLAPGLFRQEDQE